MPIARRAFKRSLLGYRRSEVDAAVAAQQAPIAEGEASLRNAVGELEAARRRIAELELVAERLSDRVVAGESELREVRAELARLQSEGLRSLVALAEELEAVRSQARGQATRIRMAALRQAAEMTGGEGSNGVEAEAAAPTPAVEAAPAKVNGNGGAPRVAEDVFVGSVEVEVGPLSDFAQLVGFEDAAGAIGATREIAVKRFAQGRATLAMELGEPVELLRELEERAPFDFKVRDLRADRLVLDVDDE